MRYFEIQEKYHGVFYFCRREIAFLCLDLMIGYISPLVIASMERNARKKGPLNAGIIFSCVVVSPVGIRRQLDSHSSSSLFRSFLYFQDT